MDQKINKIEKSKDRARIVQDRAKAWEEQNRAALKAMEILEEQAGWEDEDDEDEGDAAVAVKPSPKKNTLVEDLPAVDAAESAEPVPMDAVQEEEEIL